MVRRFLLLRCPGSGYGGGLALTAASLGAGVPERGRLFAGRRGNDYLAASPSRRTDPCDATTTSNGDANRPTEWMKEGAGWTETQYAARVKGNELVVGATEIEPRRLERQRDWERGAKGERGGKWNEEETGSKRDGWQEGRRRFGWSRSVQEGRLRRWKKRYTSEKMLE